MGIKGYRDKFRVSDETIALVEDIFQQGDGRYNDVYSGVFVAYFLENKAIEIEKKMILNSSPSEEELKSIKPPQQYYKLVGKKT